ncbi:uncharacterized protein [Parasteatoda tepidariorum]|uniref:uncharacterized protein n=1 Tax=Parasteatoda tepidariorum TaxID=114398 RepID=UPI00077F9BFC|nr:uncharacterized protein LOC107449065 [Parasteatoda tepidariorum]
MLPKCALPGLAVITFHFILVAFAEQSFEILNDFSLLAPETPSESVPSFKTKEVTSTSTREIYDQISPSRESTTPMSRILKTMDTFHSTDNASSTLATALYAPPTYNSDNYAQHYL